MPRKNDSAPRFKNANAPQCPVNFTIQLDAKEFNRRWFTTQNAAEYLGLDVNTMRKYCQAKHFPNRCRIGDELLIPLHDLVWWKNNRMGKRGRPRIDEADHNG